MFQSLEEELNLIDEAIRTILQGAQSYTINGRSVTKANLPELYKRKDQITTQIARRDGGTTAYAAWGDYR